MANSRFTHRSNTSAFTLRELVLVVAVCAGFAGLFGVTLQRATSNRATVLQCHNNLRQFAQATHLYAAENRDKVPIATSLGVSWAWDLPEYATDALQEYGMRPRFFYCPGTSPRFNDELNFLNPGSNSLWGYFGGATRIIGYATTFGGNSSALILSNQNTTVLPEPVRLTSSTYLPVPSNHERVLLADATVSQNRAGTAANPLPAGSFVNVPGGFSLNGIIVPHLSPHLRGNLPAGGNLAFKDGHVAWRKFAAMSQRAASGIGFWW